MHPYRPNSLCVSSNLLSRVGEERIVHPFDGDGMIKAITFDKGKAWFRNRFVQTPGYLEELRQQKVCRRGIFGTAKNMGAWYSNILDVRLKNVANTHVLHWNNRLFALWEGGKPFELDPVTLETLGGESNLGGTLLAGKDYAAHYKIDSQTQTVCNFDMSPHLTGPNDGHTMTIMEHDATWQLRYRKDFSLPRFGLSHDTAITDSFFVFSQSPVTFDPKPFVLGQKSVAQCIAWDDSIGKGQFHLLPRGNGKPISIDIPPAFCFHIANAYEETEENGDVVVNVDVVMADKIKMTEDLDRYPKSMIVERFDFTTEMPRFLLSRYRLNASTGKLISVNALGGEGCANLDFPVVNPTFVGKPYQFVFCSTSASSKTTMPAQTLAKIDVVSGKMIQKWLPEEHQYLGEVAFCPREGSKTEDDGYLVGYLTNGRDAVSEVVVFDATDIVKGPVAVSALRDLLPHALHGTFVSGLAPALTDEVKASFANE